MLSVKRHIALFFLVGFLFPQVAGSMHYLMVSHDFSQEKNDSYKTPEPDSLYHSCVYHLTGFYSGILPQENSIIPGNFYPPVKFSTGSLEDYVPRDNFNFLLRGPPWKSVFSEMQGL